MEQFNEYDAEDLIPTFWLKMYWLAVKRVPNFLKMKNMTIFYSGLKARLFLSLRFFLYGIYIVPRSRREYKELSIVEKEANERHR